MVVQLNGELRELPDGATVAGLLALLGIKPVRVAVLVNEAVVTRDRHAEHHIGPGDVVEVVALVSGA